MDLDLFCSKWLAAWTGNRPEELLEFYAEDALYRDPALPNGISGKELLPYFKKLLAHNPNWKWDVVEILPIKNGCCLKWKATIPIGTDLIHETGLDIVEFKEGKISRNEVYFDRTNFFNAIKFKSNKSEGTL